MKAVTCPQCGALVKRISLKDKFAVCDYCGAKILLEDNRDKIVEIPDKKENVSEKQLTPWEQYRENHRKIEEKVKENAWRDYDLPEDYQPPQTRLFIFWLIFGAIGITVLIIFIANLESEDSKPASVQPNNTLIIKTSPTVNFPTPTPLPQINYEAKVQWEGANDMEHFENPQIDNTKLPTDDLNELKKTVFKNRGVQVKVIIDTTGEVISAQAISGHPILREAAVDSAKKSLFNSRQKPTNRILTYYFRLITE